MINRSEAEHLDVWIVTINDPIYYCDLYNKIINIHSEKIKGIVLLPGPINREPASSLREIRYRFKFYGIKGFLYISLRYIRKKILRKNNLQAIAREKAIPFYEAEGLGDLRRILSSHSVDLVLATVTQLIDKQLLEMAKINWVNLHCGIIPNYKGLDAPFWTLLQQNDHIGFTIHVMNEKFDEGPIVCQERYPNRNLPYFQTVDFLFESAAHAYINLLNGPPTVWGPKTSINNDKGNYFSKPSARDGKHYRNKIGRFI